MKQETLEEAAKKHQKNTIGVALPKHTFIEGAKWQQEQYTIEEQHVGHTIDELSKEYIKGFNEGSAWQQERSYSEEDMKDYALKCISNYLFGEDFISYNLKIPIVENNNKQFEQFKKK
jgi:hypothetical protein